MHTGAACDSSAIQFLMRHVVYDEARVIYVPLCFGLDLWIALLMDLCDSNMLKPSLIWLSASKGCFLLSLKGVNTQIGYNSREHEKDMSSYSFAIFLGPEWALL